MTYIMGKPDLSSWRGNDSQQLTFVVTQDCNLRCKYCYMTDKNNKHVMSIETAKKIIDYFVDNRDILYSADYVVLDFIGGEPLLEVTLIEQIIDYFILTTYLKKSIWFGKFRIMIQSNGVLVDKPDVQRFLKKYKNMLSLGITIDGTEVKHDLQRVFPNGSGSYSIVEKNYKLAVNQKFTDSTKVTFGSEDLKYLKESIIHLWKMGIQSVPANVVYEDIWKDGDDDIYLEQLISLADYIIDNQLWDKYNTTFFSDSIGFKAPDEEIMHPICGTGNMYCVDADGDIYNCVRFMQYSLNNKSSKKIGDIYDGVNPDKIRPLKMLLTKYISDKKCLDCKINLNCTYCAGNNYDVSENDSMFYRSTATCKMFKSQVKANNYYWARLYNEQSICRETKHRHEYFMYFILSSDSINYCKFKSPEVQETIRPEDLLKGLEYAFDNFYQPVFVHSNNSMEWLRQLCSDKQYGKSLTKELKRHIIRHIARFQKNISYRDAIYVLDSSSDKPESDLQSPIILNVPASDISSIATQVNELLPFTSRININIYQFNKNFDLQEYAKQLQILCNMLYSYLEKGEKKEIRQLTDRIFMREMNNCYAGEKNITLGPDGNFYICPAFYFDKSNTVDINKSMQMTYLDSSPGCDNCDAFQCERCVYINYVGTGELNTPMEIQCKISHLERKYSSILLKKLQENHISGYGSFKIPNIDCDDPVEKLSYRIRRGKMVL